MSREGEDLSLEYQQKTLVFAKPARAYEYISVMFQDLDHMVIYNLIIRTDGLTRRAINKKTAIRYEKVCAIVKKFISNGLIYTSHWKKGEVLAARYDKLVFDFSDEELVEYKTQYLD